MLLDSTCDMGLGSTLGCTSGCTLSHFALKTSPQERFRTVQNGSELLWGCLRIVFEALFDGVFVWFLILNPIPLLVYYLRSVLHLHSVLPLCGSTSGRRFFLIYCGLFAGICYLMSRKKIANICKPLSLSNLKVFNVEVKFESFYGQTFNLKVLILKEHVRKHGPKKCARKPF